MRLTYRCGVLFLFLVGVGGCAHQQAAFQYPPTEKVSHVDVYHGVSVPDPYRWLEDPDNPKTKQWVAEQNQFTLGYLNSLPQKSLIKQRLTQLWNYERRSVPFQEGGLYFYFLNSGLQQHRVLYVTRDLNKKGKVLLDPNQWSKDGSMSLSGYSVSPDGHYLAYAQTGSGSDWKTWHIKDIRTGIDLPDKISWTKFTHASWGADSQGFYYSRYQQPKKQVYTEKNQFQQLYFHRLNSPQVKDRLVYSRPDKKKWGYGAQVSEDGAYLVVTVWKGTDDNNRIFLQRLDQPHGRLRPLVKEFSAGYAFLGSKGSTLYFRTNADAPMGKVVAVNVSQRQPQWRQVVAEQKDALEAASFIGQHLVLSYLHNAYSHVVVRNLEGQQTGEVKLPGIGTVWGFQGHRNKPETFFGFTSFTTPARLYRLDVTDPQPQALWQPKVAFNADDFVTKQVFYKSSDGTRVPMFLSYKKGLVRNGQTPTLLYGYGGFNISITPSYSAAKIAWMEMGGIYAVANIRGGGEFGQAWHHAGIKLNKQRVFDDFISAAEFLVHSGYTQPQKLAIKGSSNGGLLVGACLTQRPELFGAALPGVGVMDMLRFENFTIGWAWVDDYGSVKNADEFKALHAYSPLHNVHAGTQYPATLVTAADHDDRVVPAHSFKFVSALQAANKGKEPVMIRIETKSGHGAGSPTAKRIDKIADEWAFLAQNLHMKMPGMW